MATVKVVLIGLLAASSVLSLPNGNKPGGGKRVTLDIISEKFETCPQYPGLKNTIENLTLWNPPDEEVLYISGTLVLHVPLDDSQDYKYVMKLKKCVRKNWSSCEKYLEFDVEKMCDNLPKEQSPWAGMVKKLQEFDPHCPIRPGTYNFEDAPIDTSDLAKVEVAEGYWQIEFRTLHKSEVIFCVVGNANIKRKQMTKKRN